MKSMNTTLNIIDLCEVAPWFDSVMILDGWFVFDAFTADTSELGRIKQANGETDQLCGYNIYNNFYINSLSSGAYKHVPPPDAHSYSCRL